MRKLKFNKFGLAEDPRGLFVSWKNDREHMAEVVGAYRNETIGLVMLKTKHFCGDAGPDVAASAVEVIE